MSELEDRRPCSLALFFSLKRKERVCVACENKDTDCICIDMANLLQDTNRRGCFLIFIHGSHHDCDVIILWFLIDGNLSIKKRGVQL